MKIYFHPSIKSKFYSNTPHRMSMLILWFFLIISLFSSTIQAQNLIFNGNFEEAICESTSFRYWARGMHSGTGWLNCDFLNLDTTTCDDICTGATQQTHKILTLRFENIYTVVDLNEISSIIGGCGKYNLGTHSNNPPGGKIDFVPPFSFSHRYVVQGVSFIPNSANQQGRFSNIAQRLAKPLIENHTYYSSVFYFPDQKTFYAKIRDLDSTYWFHSIYHEFLGFGHKRLIGHDALGIAFSTNPLMERVIIPLPQNNYPAPHFLKTDANQRKLRFWLNADTLWQKWEGKFMADSAYHYLTFGNFWPTSDINFKPSRDSLSHFFKSNSTISLDSFVLWDVTVQILKDSALCSGKNTTIVSKSYSRGHTTWYNLQGEELGKGEILSMFLHQDTTLIAQRYFPEIDVYHADTAFFPILRQKPDFTLVRTDFDTCRLPASFEARPTHYEYQWNGETTIPNHTFATNDTGLITLVGKDLNGCEDTLYYTIHPEVNFIARWISDTCDEIHYIQIDPDIYSYSIQNEAQQAPYFSLTSGRIAIIGSEVNGCSDTVYIHIPVCIIPSNQQAYFPNAFSPNEDVINPTFGPVGIYIIQYHMQIFNRWGELIYQTENGTPWNGIYQNKPAQEGVYVYKINLTLQNGQQLNKMGTVHLIP